MSIKGIYYQADISGVTLTWVEPHASFAQQPTMEVDYRVMSSFLELYEAVMTACEQAARESAGKTSKQSAGGGY